MSEHVKVDRNGGVLAITLNRPDRRNAITVAMYAALADAIEGAAGDPAFGSSPSVARARISPPATISPTFSPPAARRRTKSRSGACCGRWLPAKPR